MNSPEPVESFESWPDNLPLEEQVQRLGRVLVEHFPHTFDRSEGAMEKAARLLQEGDQLATEALEALRLTVEYVGVDVLRPRPGWSWYDVMSKRPEYASWLDSMVNPQPLDAAGEGPPA